MQAALPALLFARQVDGEASSVREPSLLTLHGGTDAEFAPPVGYMQKILLPTLRRLWAIDVEDQVASPSLGSRRHEQIFGAQPSI